MCGRYALALRPSQIRRMLQDDNMPVWDAPDDGDGAAADYDGGDGGDGGGGTGPRSSGRAGAPPRQSYNFAPGYHGLVYRADVPDYGAGPRPEKKKGHPSDEPEAESSAEAAEIHYKLQSMKWGLIPFWTKRNPDYASVMKTINCREDSLAAGGGMWSTMKARKRCIVIAQGFYEWLKTGPKEKTPHYVKRKDGHLMCFAGLWDCVQYDDDDQKHYTYTIITTDSNKQLKFLHDRMPVIFDPGSEKLRTWLDPSRYEWSKELQALLRPFDGELEVYPVSKEVGKVGNNSPSFIIPVASKENKSNIANFFAAKGSSGAGGKAKAEPVETRTKERQQDGERNEPHQSSAESKTASQEAEREKGGFTTASPAKTTGKAASTETTVGTKRGADRGALDGDEPPRKITAMLASPSPKKPTPTGGGRPVISATKNQPKSPSKQKAKPAGTQKITKFFSK